MGSLADAGSVVCGAVVAAATSAPAFGAAGADVAVAVLMTAAAGSGAEPQAGRTSKANPATTVAATCSAGWCLPTGSFRVVIVDLPWQRLTDGRFAD
jgi:hypothetical protein